MSMACLAAVLTEFEAIYHDTREVSPNLWYFCEVLKLELKLNFNTCYMNSNLLFMEVLANDLKPLEKPKKSQLMKHFENIA